MTRRFDFLIALSIVLATTVVAKGSNPVLSVSPTTLNFKVATGTASSQAVTVRNAGNGALKWNVTNVAVSWLTVFPTSGTNSGVLTVTARAGTLPPGNYATTFRVTSNAGTVTVQVNMAIFDDEIVIPPGDAQYGPRASITCPVGAVAIAPGESIQAAVTANANGTAFCLEAGVHSITSAIVPKTGNTFVGEYGAIIDGSGWSSSDNTQGAFRGHNVDVDDVTIRNLVIRNMPQRGVHAWYEFSNNWTVEYCELAYNLTGIHMGTNSLVQYNYIHHNTGVEDDPNPALRGGGYGAFRGSGTVFQYNEIAHNNSEQKIVRAIGVVFRGNYVHHNSRDGIWYDADNIDSLIEDNVVEDHVRTGIFYEVSGNGIIRNNIVRRSVGLPNNSAGLFISTSKNLDVYSNEFVDNHRGIWAFCDGPRVGEGSAYGHTSDLSDNDIHDNIIRHTSTSHFGSVMTTSGVADPTPYTSNTKNNNFTANTYYVPNSTGSFWWWAASKTWTTWQAVPQDADGTRIVP